MEIFRADPSEMEVFKRWAYLRKEGLKKKATSFWIEQFGEALDMPYLWEIISRLL
jgi:hypothetical protein